MAIDLHAHYVPRDVADLLRARTAAPFIESLPEGGERFHMPVGVLDFTPAYLDVDDRVAYLDQIGIDIQVLSFPGLFGVDSLPSRDAMPMVRAFNDDVAAVCRRHPSRYFGLAALPMADIDAAIGELQRAVGDDGLIGAILPVNAFASAAQAERIYPLLAAGQELRAHFFIHPGPRPDEISPAVANTAVHKDNMMQRRALDVQADVAQAMITLLFSDILDRYSGITIHVANLGGTLPMVIERMDHTAAVRSPQPHVPSSRMHRLHVDCSSLGPRAIEAAVACYGADKIVVGTDTPIFSAEWTLAAIRDANITPDQRQAILRENARRLLAPLRRGKG